MIGWTRKNNRAARAARSLVQFSDVVCQMTTWTHNRKSFILSILFNGASTSPFLCSSIIECEQKAIIAK